jgi:hypothetical protein
MNGYAVAVNNNTGAVGTFSGLSIATVDGAVENAFAIFLADQDASSLSIGLFSNITPAAGKFELLLDGGAQNFIKGDTKFGANVDMGAKLGSSGAIALADGMTAPTQTASYAKIFVDSADGDLKVIFSNGFTAVIAADS